MPPSGGAFFRRFTRFTGLYFDEFANDSAWIREEGILLLPPLAGIDEIVVRGEFRPHPGARGIEATAPGLDVRIGGRRVGSLRGLRPGPWEARVAIPSTRDPAGTQVTLRLTGVGFTNALAWLGRVTRIPFLGRFRAQAKNRQLRIAAIESGTGERIYDFSCRPAPYSTAFARRHSLIGMNIVGFLSADLGIGESARCMVRAADAAGIPVALVPLRLNCKNRHGDSTYASRLQETNPHGVNVFHVDPPAARDIDHHHGGDFRRGKYNIGYFAWELPEFPDAWLSAFDYFDEVWCPSDFTGSAIALKSPLPVLTMPHSITLPSPAGDRAVSRRRLGLPAGDLLFLSLFDMNSYAERKNPRGAIEAFRRSGLAGHGATLVLKVQNGAGNEDDLAGLKAAVRDLPGTILLTETLSRADVYALEDACDCLLSLHRSEGFGLVVAECMFLAKPVIATDWSATAEYLNSDNGCPVRSAPVTLERHHGPYAKGSTWAEPDLGHAAEWMRRIFEDRSLAERLGGEARRTVQDRFAPAAVGARYRSRLEVIACF